jgi:hypothetical protein
MWRIYSNPDPHGDVLKKKPVIACSSLNGKKEGQNCLPELHM